jgi:hypothetical protein
LQYNGTKWINSSFTQVISGLPTTTTINCTADSYIILQNNQVKTIQYQYMPPADSIKRYVTIWEDFFSGTNTNILDSFNSGSGASANGSQPADEFSAGVDRITTGTTTTGRAGFQTLGSIRLDAFDELFFLSRIKLNNLSTDIDNFEVNLGYTDSNSSSGAYGLYFMYNHQMANGNWHIMSINNNFSILTSTISASVGNYVKLGILYKDNLVHGYINDENIGSVSTNIPSGVGSEVNLVLTIRKLAGTSARTFDIDYVLVNGVLKNVR